VKHELIKGTSALDPNHTNVTNRTTCCDETPQRPKYIYIWFKGCNQPWIQALSKPE
jgi:hypothetical protein